MKFNFISGLPRSGSTLLAVLLKQNPRFHAHISSPVANLFENLEGAMSGNEVSVLIETEELRQRFLKSLFYTYYKKYPEVVFDTNRMWNSRIDILMKLFSKAKFIICVRDIGWIANSFEKLFKKNNQRPSGIYGWNNRGTVYDRINLLLNPDGVIGFAINATKEALASENSKNCIIVDYRHLCYDPAGAMKVLYDFLQEDYYTNHNFDSFSFSTELFDKTLEAEGLHTVVGPVRFEQQKLIIPQDLFEEVNKKNFW